MKFKHTPTKKQQKALLARVHSLNPGRTFTGRVDEYTGYFRIESLDEGRPPMVYGEYTRHDAESILGD